MARSDDAAGAPPRRSAGALRQRRVLQPWPANRDFRILSIDGGGIRGIYPAALLAGLEERYLGGRSIVDCFDLVTGTSTGGILAIGLAAGLNAAALRDLYVERGREIFPPPRGGAIGAARHRLRSALQYFRYRYDRDALVAILTELLGEAKFGSARVRLCIPSFDGRYGEVYIFKTPHHPDFRKDAYDTMVKVASATAAAPTFFQPLRDGGYTFVDGGVWANNPIMIGVVDALSCFAVARERISVLSIGCGDDPYVVDDSKISKSGIWHWRDIIFAAMRLQSLNALGQAGLLIGADRILRVDAPVSERKIAMDDWSRAREELPPLAEQTLTAAGDEIAARFLSTSSERYQPLIVV